MNLEAWENIKNILKAGGQRGPGLFYITDGHGRVSRKDGPAVVHDDGTMIWYLENQIHREDGPAIIRCNGDLEWWRFGSRSKKLRVRGET